MSKFVDMLVLRKLQNLSTSCWYLMVWSYEGTVMLLCVYLSLPYEDLIGQSGPIRFLSLTGQVDRLTLAAHSGVEPKLSESRLSQQSKCMQVQLLRTIPRNRLFVTDRC